MVTNILSDTYVRIKNGYKLHLKEVLVLKSNKVISVLDVLYLEGFIRGYVIDSCEQNKIKVLLKYSLEGEACLKNIIGVSKSCKRVYLNTNSLWSLYSKSNISCFILSTSKGVVSLNKALYLNVGGELLCYVS